MLTIWISYSHLDENIADKILVDLKNQKHDVRIDKSDFKTGNVLLENVDGIFKDSDIVLGIITENYCNSIGMKEAYIAINKSFREKYFYYIPLFMISPSKVESEILRNITGVDFTNDYEDCLDLLLDKIQEIEGEVDDPREIISKIESMNSINPFRRFRTETYHKNYELIARMFAEPEKEKYETVKDKNPLIIFGGRGSGKTMILKSLTPEVIMSRINKKTFSEAIKNGIDYFGIYFKLKRGSLSIYDYDVILKMGYESSIYKNEYDKYKKLIKSLNNGTLNGDPIINAGLNSAWTISMNEMNYKLLKVTIEKLNNMSKNKMMHITSEEENNLVQTIMYLLSDEIQSNTFDELLIYSDIHLKKIRDYTQKLSLPFFKPLADWNFTGIDFLNDLFKLISTNIFELKNVQFYLLFDEYENLRPYQQKIVNEWIKTSDNFVIKIACKFECLYTKDTLQGQSLQFGQDWYSLDLNYDLFDKKSTSLYQNLLIEICKRTLINENYKETDIRKLLITPDKNEFSQKVIDAEIKNIRDNSGLDFEPHKIRQYRNQLQVSVIYRLLRKRGYIEGQNYNKKIYAGFNTFTFLSSGIIRIFLNLAGMAIYKAGQEGTQVQNGEPITIIDQTWASNAVSKYWLDIIIDNMEEYGEYMYNLILDIGHIFRERLLFNSSEPESLIIGLTNPLKVTISNTLINSILKYGIKESILYEKKEASSYRPHRGLAGMINEYVLNRIYSPVLDISYRSRGGSRFYCTSSELNALLTPRLRNTQKRILMNRQIFKNGENQKGLEHYMRSNDE